jgi:hypothetical protein
MEPKLCNERWEKRVLISTPTLGIVRYEWAHARYSQVVPVNWACQGFDLVYAGESGFGPVGYNIDDAYNLISDQAIKSGVDWLLTVEDDVILPPYAFVRFTEYMNEAKYPVVSGLYYTKGYPSEPLLFRGRGNGPLLEGWKIGETVWCDGLPMGCLLLHTSILKWFAERSDTYTVPTGEKVKRIFETPRKFWLDENGCYQRQEGTQDLYFFDKLLDNGGLAECGWTDFPEPEHPLLCDTSIFCKHIDRVTGQQYPQ